MRRLAVMAFVVLAVACGVSRPCAGGEVFDDATLQFLHGVDAWGVGMIGVRSGGRDTILDTLARGRVGQMYGGENVDGVPPAVAWLELYLNAGRYLDKPLIFVKESKVRQFLAGRMNASERAVFERTHRLRPSALLDEEARKSLAAAGRATPEEVRRAAEAPSLREALGELSEQMEMRLDLERLSARYEAFLSPDSSDALTEAIGPLEGAWRSRDAFDVNLPVIRESLVLPEGVRITRELELTYNRTYKGTVVFVGFALAVVLFIVGITSGRVKVGRAGGMVMVLSTFLLLAGFIVRWVLSGRGWLSPPMVNQFEAVTASALLGAILALGLELVWRRNYFALAASFYATVALLWGFLRPEAMGAEIIAAPGILNSPVMAAHVAIIIIGHALVGMTFVISLAYLAVALICGLPVEGDEPASALYAMDRCNLIVAQLATFCVALGTIFGAYWGDFAWGRWWGWDPKETWALITVLVYLGVLHARFATPPRHRGLVTALLCVLGCAVMLFNWIFVNYFLAGKHSYA